MSELGFFTNARGNTDSCHMVSGQDSRFLAVLSVMPPKIKSDLLLCLTVNWGLYAIFAFQERYLTGCKITVWPQSWQELHHFSCGCSCSLWKHALSVIMLMEKSLIMDVWIWMCFAKGTSARLYKHCPNLQEATKVMTPAAPPTTMWGPSLYYPLTLFSSVEHRTVNTTDTQY